MCCFCFATYSLYLVWIKLLRLPNIPPCLCCAFLMLVCCSFTILLVSCFFFLAAINFLIETGTLLHFPDTSHGLRNLYFLDPVWLSECLQRIFNIKSSKSVAKNGVIRAEDLRMLLVGTGFTEQTEEQYFQFLAKFEIALPVANNR